MHLRIITILALLVALAPAAFAETEASTALPSEHHALAQVTASAGYQRLPGEIHAGNLELGARVLFGHRVAYCVGIDAAAGASSEGALYRAEALLTGVGLRFGDAGLIALCAGAGVGGAPDVIPTALQLPVELRLLTQLGSLRLAGHVTARFIPLDDARNTGDPIDELDATLAIGMGSQQAYWRGASAGSGPYVAVTYRHLLSEDVFGLAVGVELLGAN